MQRIKMISAGKHEFQMITAIEASTSHISKTDDTILKAHVAKAADNDPQSPHPQVIMDYGPGFIVSVWHPDHEPVDVVRDDLLKKGHSEAYVNLVLMASRTGAKWLILDCDAAVYNFLPMFEQ